MTSHYGLTRCSPSHPDGWRDFCFHCGSESNHRARSVSAPGGATSCQGDHCHYLLRHHWDWTWGLRRRVLPLQRGRQILGGTELVALWWLAVDWRVAGPCQSSVLYTPARCTVWRGSRQNKERSLLTAAGWLEHQQEIFCTLNQKYSLSCRFFWNRKQITQMCLKACHMWSFFSVFYVYYDLDVMTSFEGSFLSVNYVIEILWFTF